MSALRDEVRRLRKIPPLSRRSPGASSASSVTGEILVVLKELSSFSATYQPGDRIFQRSAISRPQGVRVSLSDGLKPIGHESPISGGAQAPGTRHHRGGSREHAKQPRAPRNTRRWPQAVSSCTCIRTSYARIEGIVAGAPGADGARAGRGAQKTQQPAGLRRYLDRLAGRSRR